MTEREESIEVIGKEGKTGFTSRIETASSIRGIGRTC